PGHANLSRDVGAGDGDEQRVRGEAVGKDLERRGGERDGGADVLVGAQGAAPEIRAGTVLDAELPVRGVPGNAHGTAIAGGDRPGGFEVILQTRGGAGDPVLTDQRLHLSE